MTKFNFSAGPGVLPKIVLEKVQNEFLDYRQTESSICEISHRSEEFMACMEKAETDFKSLLHIPTGYKVLFMQGGASIQFSAIIYNMITDLRQPIDYIVTGTWSDKAAQEAKRLGANVNVVFNSKSTNHNGDIPPLQELKFSKDPAFIYYCDNETVHGVEMPQSWVNGLPTDIPIICDMSSNFLSRPVEIEKYAIIFGGAQKNIGPAGVTIVIVREDLLGRFEKCPLAGPLMLDYKTCADNSSMYNTPPCFAIYVSGLVFQWLIELGGLEKMNEINSEKAGRLYKCLEKYPLHFSFPVIKKENQSRMNVPFRICKNGVPNEELEKKFLIGAQGVGCFSLNGHRSVGGIRASLYNALDSKAVDTLVEFIEKWALLHE